MQHAVTAVAQNNKLHEALYKRTTELDIQISEGWRELRNDTQVLTVVDENADMWASFNARRRELGL